MTNAEKMALKMELKEDILKELRDDHIIVRKVTVEGNDRTKLLLNTLLEYICGYCGIDENEVKSNTRKGDVVRCRAYISYIARTIGGIKISLSEIGKILNRDHASVLYLTRMMIDEISYNKALRHDIEHLTRLFISEFGTTLKIYEPQQVLSCTHS